MLSQGNSSLTSSYVMSSDGIVAMLDSVRRMHVQAHAMCNQDSFPGQLPSDLAADVFRKALKRCNEELGHHRSEISNLKTERERRIKRLKQKRDEALEWIDSVGDGLGRLLSGDDKRNTKAWRSSSNAIFSQLDNSREVLGAMTD